MLVVMLIVCCSTTNEVFMAWTIFAATVAATSGIRQGFHDHREFVTSQAGDLSVERKLCDNLPANAPQQLVSRVMSEAVLICLKRSMSR